MQTKWLSGIGQFAKENSPAILSGIAIGGVVATAFLAVKATPRAMKKLEEAQFEGDEITNLDRVKVTWKLYIPAALSGAATIACVVGANTIGARRNTALVAAYTLVDSAFREYKDKVLQEIGETKERKINEAIMQDRIDKNPPKDTEVLIIEDGDQLCYDAFSGRYFKSNIETIRRAENDVNHLILTEMYASHNEFYKFLGLPDADAGDLLGWNLDHRLQLVFSSHLQECTGKPCLAIKLKEEPVKDYYKTF